MSTPPQWLNQTVTVYQVTGVNDSGEPTYDGGTSTPCRLAHRVVRIRQPNGVVEVTTTQIYVDASTSVDVEDKIGFADGTEALIVEVATVADPSGTSIIKVIRT